MFFFAKKGKTSLDQSCQNRFVEELTACKSKGRHFFQDVERLGRYSAVIIDFFFLIFFGGYQMFQIFLVGCVQVPLRVPESPFYLLGVLRSDRQQGFLAAAKMRHPGAGKEEFATIFFFFFLRL